MTTAEKEQSETAQDHDKHHIDDPYIAERLEHCQYGIGLEEAYRSLTPIAKEADDSRGYLRNVYVSHEGFAVATDAHVLGVLKLAESIAMEINEPIAYPVPESHKTDDIELKPDRIVVDCDHQTDLSGEHEVNDVADLPDYSQVIMATDDVDHDDKRSSLGLNTRLLNLLGNSLNPDDENPEPLTEIIFNGEMDPCIVRSKVGYGVIMPLRFGSNTFGYKPYSA